MVEEVLFETLEKSDLIGPLVKYRGVIKNEQQLRKLYDSLDPYNPEKNNYLSFPSVDFSQDMVIAVARGQCPLEGYDIAIKELLDYEGKLVVIINETNPQGELEFPACTYPRHIIKTKNYVGHVEFRKKNEIKS